MRGSLVNQQVISTASHLKRNGLQAVFLSHPMVMGLRVPMYAEPSCVVFLVDVSKDTALSSHTQQLY